MYNIILHNIAEEVLFDLVHSNKKEYQVLFEALNEIEEEGFRASNTKSLANTDKIFRKRVRRWRILFTMEGADIHIWIIAIEKDTKKDYKKWIKYISYQI